MIETYRHGDVLLLRRSSVAECPEGNTEVVVAEGETTGHAHRVRGPMVQMVDLSTAEIGGVLRVYLPQGGEIVHEEHRRIVLPPGTYEVRRQKTMTSPGTWERVRD